MMPSEISKEKIDFIRDNIHLLEVDYENGKILNRKENLGGNGYLRISLNHKLIKAHHIIAFMKYGYECIGLTVNHEDAIKTNNRPENLTIMTSAENVRLGRAKITEGQAWQVRWCFWRGLKQREISEMLNVPLSTVQVITSGYAWKHVEHDNLGIKRMTLEEQGLIDG